MQAINRTLGRALLAISCLLAPGLSQASVGSVAITAGDVKVVRGAVEVPVKVGTALQPGDVVRTGAESKVLWKMKDGSIFGLPKDSSLRIDTFTPKSVQSGGTAIFSMLKGAFRTVSGLIGKGSGDTYAVNTPVATMGIRGTDYMAVLYKGDSKRRAGLYETNKKGKTVIKNAEGSVEVSAGQAAHAGSAPIMVDLKLVADIFASAGLDDLDADFDALLDASALGLTDDVHVQIRQEGLPPVVPPEVPASPSVP